MWRYVIAWVVQAALVYEYIRLANSVAFGPLCHAITIRGTKHEDTQCSFAGLFFVQVNFASTYITKKSAVPHKRTRLNIQP